MKLKRYLTSESLKDKNCSEYEIALIMEVKLDFTSFKGIEHLKQHTGYLFDIDDTTIMLKGYSTGNRKWNIKFGPYDGKRDILNIDMTNKFNTKETIETIKQISKCLYLFMKYYNPLNIRFSADRPSRQKMYERVVSKLIYQKEFMQYSLKTHLSDTDDVIYYEIYKK